MKLPVCGQVFLWLGVAIVPCPLNAQEAATVGWEFFSGVDDFSGKADSRLVVAAERESSDRLGDTVRARLIVACGKIFRGNGDKTIVFDAGIPVQWTEETILGKQTDIEVRFDGDDKPKSRRGLQFVDQGTTMIYLGDFNGFFFSKSVFKSLMSSNQMRIRFTPLLGNSVETVAFDVRGLPQEIAKLDKCQWPR